MPAQIKPKSLESRRIFFLTLGGCVSCLRRCLGAWALCCFHTLTITQAFGRALTPSVDSCMEMKWLQWRNQFWQSLEEGVESDARSSHSPPTWLKLAFGPRVKTCNVWLIVYGPSGVAAFTHTGSNLLLDHGSKIMCSVWLIRARAR